VNTVILRLMGGDAVDDVPPARAESADVGDGGEAGPPVARGVPPVARSDEVEVPLSRGRRG